MLRTRTGSSRHCFVEIRWFASIRFRMPEPLDVADTWIELDAADREWLRARLIEYRELLAYLRDH